MSERRGRLLDRVRLRRVGAAAVLVAIGVAAGQAADDGSPAPIPGTARAAVAAPELVDAPPDVAPLPPLVDGPARSLDVDLPTEEAGTHRTWFAVGTWWAVLPDPTTGVHRIWGLSGPDGPWIDTGTLVDERPEALVDAAWDGEDLVVATTGTRPYRSHALRVHRFGWSVDEGRWVPAADHPIELTTEGEPLARLAVTADGTAWLVRPRGSGLEVARTAGRAPRWAGWTPLPVGAGIGGFDVVGGGDDIVVVTRRTATDVVAATRRAGEGWTTTEVAVPGSAGTGPIDASRASDDGPLAVLVAPTGDHGAAGDQAPTLLLAVIADLTPGDAPATVSVVARAVDGMTRPSLVVDGDRARVFAIVPPSPEEVVAWYERGQGAPTVLVEKTASLSDPLFGPGSGTRLMSGVDGAPLARPLLPSAVGPEGGLVAVASGGEARRWSTWTDGVPPAPRSPAPTGGDGITVLVDDTFDSLPVGGPGPTSWAAEDSDPPVGEVVVDPATGTRALRLVGGPDPVSACRAIPELPAQVLTVEATVRSSGTVGTADTRLLTVRGSGGSIASARLSRLGLVGWSTSQGRQTAPQPIAPGATLLVSIRLDLVARSAAITIRSDADAVLAEGAGIPWLSVGDGSVDELCVRAAPGEGTEVVVDTVRVTQR